LAKRLAHPNKETHRLASEMNLEPFREAIGPILLKHLADEDVQVRIRAARRLGCMAPMEDSTPLLLAAMDAGDSPLIYASLLAAHGEHARSLTPRLLKLLDDDPTIVALRGVLRVMRATDPNNPAILPLILRGLRTGDLTTEEAAIKTAAWIGAPAVPTVLQAFSNKSSPARKAAARALSRLSWTDASAIDALLEGLSDSDPNVRASIAYALARMGRPAFPSLVKACRSEDAPTRIAAAKGLAAAAKWVSQSELKLVLELSSSEPAVRKAVLACCGPFAKTNPAAKQAIMQGLDDEDRSVRVAAAEIVLAQPDHFEVSRAVEILCEVAHQGDFNDAITAYDALKKSTAPLGAGAPSLIQASRKEGHPFQADLALWVAQRGSAAADSVLPEFLNQDDGRV
ncbi:MAG: HEAT repeat domain-containing protein, partial [Planctomycetales bacterium]